MHEHDWRPRGDLNSSGKVMYQCASCGELGFRRWTTRGLMPIAVCPRNDGAPQHESAEGWDDKWRAWRMRLMDERRGQCQADGWRRGSSCEG